MATERWIAGSGVGFTWTTCFPSSDLDSMANGNSVLSSTGDINNQSALDIFADVGFSLGSVTSTGTPYMALYLYPLNQDGSTYGDNQFTPGTDSSAVPGSNYWVSSAMLPVGTQALIGMFRGIIIPPGTFRWLIQNKAGVTLAGSGNTVKYRTYNRAVA